MTLKNSLYLKFKKEGDIKIITDIEISKACANIKGKNAGQGRALLWLFYYTGARPAELSKVQAQDITAQPGYILAKIRGAKRGLTRTIYLKVSRPGVKEILKYADNLIPGMYIFKDYFGAYRREYVNKKTGGIKEIIEVSDKFRYHFKKWFKGVVDIPPYYLRHNRFSQLIANGVNSEEIRILKGGKTLQSVAPYLHLSSLTAKKTARYIR
jgi:integrase